MLKFLLDNDNTQTGFAGEAVGKSGEAVQPKRRRNRAAKNVALAKLGFVIEEPTGDDLEPAAAPSDNVQLAAAARAAEQEPRRAARRAAITANATVGAKKASKSRKRRRTAALCSRRTPAPVPAAVPQPEPERQRAAQRASAAVDSRRSASSTATHTRSTAGGSRSGLAAVRERTADVGQIVDVGGGGDCMLLSVIDQLAQRSVSIVHPFDQSPVDNRSLTFEELRRWLHQWLAHYRHSFEEFINSREAGQRALDEHRSWEHFLELTGTPHAYLQHLHLTALATMLNATIHVYDTAGVSYDTVIAPLPISAIDITDAEQVVACLCPPSERTEQSRTQSRSLFVVYLFDPNSNFAHYQSIRPPAPASRDVQREFVE